jgi:hypothetical protein
MENMMNREDWLTKAVVELSGLFKRNGLDLPDCKCIAVSCGWPSGPIKKVAGECWPNDQSDGGVFEIFISPRISDANGDCGVLAVLVHELLHINVGLEHKHKTPFKKAMKIIGLEGKAAASVAGPDLLTEIGTILQLLGPYPHSKLNLKDKPVKNPIKKLIKVRCPECDYIIQVKRTLFEEKGAPLCPIHGKKFEEDKLTEVNDA